VINGASAISLFAKKASLTKGHFAGSDSAQALLLKAIKEKQPIRKLRFTMGTP
jgi:hypothetical protein